jgi:photosystem II stability/assembly factor-like uncharacterized protein
MRRFVALSVTVGLQFLISAILDAGINRWTPSGPPVNVFAIAAGRGPAGIVYASAGLEGGVFRSSDYGDTWERITEETVDLIAVDAGNPNVLYASRSMPQRGVYKSIDGGRTWQLANEGLLYGTIVLMLRAVALNHVYGVDFDFGGFYETTDQAATWNRVSDGLFGISAFTVDPTNIRRLYAAPHTTGRFGQILWSDDGGRAWTPGIDSAGYGHPKTDIVVDPSRPSHVYAGASCCGSFFRSFDFGRSWEHVTAPDNQISSIVVDFAGTVFLGTGPGACPSAIPCPPTPTGVFRSADSGRTWFPMNEGLDGRSVRRLLLLAGGRRLMALANPSGIFVYEFGSISDIPDMSFLARVLTCVVLATIGVLAIRAIGTSG